MLKGRGGSQKLPLGRALSIHVLHLICVEGIRGGAKSKAFADEVLYLLWCPYAAHPVLASTLWFLPFFCVLKEPTVLLSLGVRSVCVPHCSLPLSVMRKAWKNNVWGQSRTPLMSVSSPLLILCSRFSRWQRWSLQISYRCGPFDTFWCKTNNYSCACTDTRNKRVPTFSFLQKCSCTCHHQQNTTRWYLLFSNISDTDLDLSATSSIIWHYNSINLWQ